MASSRERAAAAVALAGLDERHDAVDDPRYAEREGHDDREHACGGGEVAQHDDARKEHDQAEDQAEDAVSAADAAAEDRQRNARDTSEDEVDGEDSREDRERLAWPHEQGHAERDAQQANEAEGRTNGVDAVLSKLARVELEHVDAHAAHRSVVSHCVLLLVPTLQCAGHQRQR